MYYVNVYGVWCVPQRKECMVYGEEYMVHLKYNKMFTF